MYCEPGVLLLIQSLAERLMWFAVGLVMGLGIEHLAHPWERVIRWLEGGGRWTSSGRK